MGKVIIESRLEGDLVLVGEEIVMREEEIITIIEKGIIEVLVKENLVLMEEEIVEDLILREDKCGIRESNSGLFVGNEVFCH